MNGELRILLFLDQSNLHGQAHAANRKLDYVRLMNFLADPREGRRRIDCYCYAPLPQENGDRVQRWHDFLRHSGMQVVSKRAKRMPDGRVKADMDMALAMDALELGTSLRPDVVVIASGDGDMAPLAIRLRRLGIRVEVASSTQALANEMRASCQGVIELDDFLADCEPLAGAAEEIGVANILEPMNGHARAGR